MSFNPVRTQTDVANTAAGFWRRFGQALEAYSVDRTKRAVPEIALRRSKHEIDRYRRLMLKGSMAPAEAGIRRGPPGRVAQAWPRR
jgi:hypothetical protein